MWQVVSMTTKCSSSISVIKMIEFSSSSASGLEGSTTEGVRCCDSSGPLRCTQRIGEGLVVEALGYKLRF